MSSSRTVYRKGAPALGLGLLVVAAGGVAFGLASNANAHRYDAEKAKAAAVGSSTAGAPLDTLGIDGKPERFVKIPVRTEPAGARVVALDDKRTILCNATPCEITLPRSVAERLAVSLELARHATTKAHVKDALDVPGGEIQLSFGPAVEPQGDLLGAFASRPGPRLRQGTTTVEGRLPPEVIQRIVRQSFGRFRLCYENGLRNAPALSGRVVVRFGIDRSGAGTNVADGGSEMADRAVTACVMRGFESLSFPQPEGGTVSVVYPISFSPGES